MKRIGIVLVCLAITGLTLFGIFTGPAFRSDDGIDVTNGIAIVSEEQLSAPAQLNGKWTFYPDEFLDPNQPPDIDDTVQTLRVPAGWNNRFNDGRFQAGTYRVVIYVPEDGQYGMKAPAIRNASRVFINGTEAEKLGSPALESGRHKYEEAPVVAYGQSKDGEIDLIIHVSNSGTNGGVAKPVYFGEADVIMAFDKQNQLVDSIVIAGYFMLGLLLLFHYLIGGRLRFELFFAMFCFMQALYSSTQNEALLRLVWQDIDRFTMLNLQLSSLVFSVLFFFLFIEFLFNGGLKGKWKVLLTVFLILYGVEKFIPGLTEKIVTAGLPEIVQFFPVTIIVTAFLPIIFTIFAAYRRRLAGSAYLLTATAAFACYGLSLGLDYVFALDSGSIPLMLLFLMSISFAMFMAHRRQLAYNEATRLSTELLVQDRMKDNFLIRTSGELKEPISELMADTGGLITGNAGPLNRTQQERMLVIGRKAKRLRRMAESLEIAGGVQLPKMCIAPISAGEVKDMAEEVVILLNDSGTVPVEINISDNLPSFSADHHGLRQVLHHLISFSVQSAGGDEVVVKAEVHGDNVRLSVEGTRKDIQDGDARRLFDPFFQMQDNPTERVRLDLNLPIAGRLVPMMGGHLETEFPGHHRLRITACFPVAQGNISAKVPLSDNAPISEGWQTGGRDGYAVLVVGRSSAQATDLSFLLGGEGYRVYAVISGAAAIEALKQVQFDLVVIDLRIPDMPGTTVVRWIRKCQDDVAMPVLLISEVDEDEEDWLPGNKGITDRIRRSAGNDEFLARVRMILAMKEAVAESVRRELAGYHGQIVPHFLYNTLNTVIALSYEEPARVREALENLSVYFRSKLDYQRQQGLVPLADEIEFVRAYLDIEKLRFGDRISIVEDVNEEIDVMIPAMTIQPIIENAIVHGLANKEDGALLTWRVYQEEDGVIIEVSDNGHGMTPERQQAVLTTDRGRFGIRNPMNKLGLVRGSDFKLESEAGKGTKVTIRLPLGVHLGGSFKS